jgi:outer membrane protein assembly factor BamE (lipoprotein component of BamABCDE complex)
MKTINAILLPVVFLGLCLCLWGCAWSHYTEGSVFDASDINQIVKGKTTTTDLMNILGTPYSKTPGADGGEQWLYFCSSNFDMVHLDPLPLLPVTENTRKQQKNLIVSLNKDKVVVDYTLTEGPIVKKSETAVLLTPLPVAIDVYSHSETNSKTEGGNPKH